MVKLLSSYINFVMAQYIIEPKKTLKKWCRSHVKICSLTNFEYVYCKDPNKIDLYELSKSNTIMAKLILKKYPIDWQRLSYNSSKWAYRLLDNIDWILLSKNPSKWARKLLKNNPDKINWNYLSENPYLFKIIKTNYKLFDIILHKKLI